MTPTEAIEALRVFSGPHRRVGWTFNWAEQRKFEHILDSVDENDVDEVTVRIATTFLEQVAIWRQAWDGDIKELAKTFGVRDKG